ncbi:MAG TPA: hypothetical protein VIK74_07635 [Parasegetibacter sp.]|jgi:hypothetical protein
MKRITYRSKYLGYLLAAMVTFNSCRKEEKLTASPPQTFYVLPQGNAPADAIIVDFHQKYGSYILYKFNQSDYAYNYVSKHEDSAFNANPEYIDTALNFFMNQLVVHYPDAFLKKTLPFKILLASYIGSGASRSATGFATTRSALTIGWADSTILGKTAAQAKAMRALLHRYYWERAIRTRSVEIPPAFAALAPSYSTITNTNRYAEGVVAPAGGIYLEADFLGYIELITGKTTAELESTLFLPATDKKGLIRMKYDAVQEYFLTEYNLDLKAIGQLP